MKKYIELSTITYKAFFEPLNAKYNWHIDIEAPKVNETVYTIYTEEPILNEIRAALNTQIKYAEHLVDLIEDAKEY